MTTVRKYDTVRKTGTVRKYDKYFFKCLVCYRNKPVEGTPVCKSKCCADRWALIPREIIAYATNDYAYHQTYYRRNIGSQARRERKVDTKVELDKLRDTVASWIAQADDAKNNGAGLRRQLWSFLHWNESLTPTARRLCWQGCGFADYDECLENGDVFSLYTPQLTLEEIRENLTVFLNTVVQKQIAIADPTDPTDPRDPKWPMDPTDPTDPMDPRDPADPRDPMDPTEPRWPMDPADPNDDWDSADPADAIRTLQELGRPFYFDLWTRGCNFDKRRFPL